MKNKILAVITATHVENYKIKIKFQDGAEPLVDFGDFLTKSTNPAIKKYLDLNNFKTFKILNGQLMWGDFELIFPIDELYQGKISA